MDSQPYDKAILISSLRGGGAERVAAELCNHWSSEGQRVALLTNSDASDDSYSVDSSIQRVILNMENKSAGPLSGITQNIHRLIIVRKALKQLKPQCLLGFNTTSNVLAILASFGLDCKIVVAERSYPAFSVSNPAWRMIRRFAYKFADIVVVQTEVGAHWIREHTFANRVEVIPNAVALPLQIAGPVIEPDDFLPASTRLIIGVGSIKTAKGFERLLSAFASSQANSLDWRLAIVGAGDNTALKQQAQELGILDKVLFIGRTGNVQRWYERADLFVLSSHNEGFPNVLIEAMAAGCAVISVDCLSGPAEIIQHDVNGLLVAADDDALSQGISEMASDDSRRHRLAVGAKNVVVDFSPKRINLLWKKILDDESLQLPDKGVV